ncbi:MAG: glycosyltransferase family 2 protein [Gemmataceae bacterium]|nr:glycosyltransferase family 2 protein [Gemmataceae bacterium]
MLQLGAEARQCLSRRAVSPATNAAPPRPRVSVCIANWNCRRLLRGCLHSLVRTPQGVPLEVIVVDNASTDGAPELVRREFPEAILIANPVNRGFAAASNQAASVAAGEYLFFLNNDTIVPPRTVGLLCDLLAARPDAAMVGPRLVGADGQPQSAPRRQPTIRAFLHRTFLGRCIGLGRRDYAAYRRPALDVHGPCEVELLMGAAVMLRRDVFHRLGGWDEAFSFGGEDMDLCRRARQHGPILYHPAVSITHFGSSGTKENIAYAAPRIQAGFVRYFRKAGVPPPVLWLYKLVLTVDAPLQVAARACQAAWRFVLCRPAAARKAWHEVRAGVAFLTGGLGMFWRA